ncbi:Zn-dependent hydrolase [Rhizobium sp. CECT 9324]|uniref:Zn-dependent hydrolase n=1 Tax=Rhizobium sp. CECT 9324 TaxID=2845820 RepID=UPI001E43969B|nr:Zn-dependent hydrolase [Rhizobium sp. CECT 9324]CAH0343343.1 N-carbamoyl-L-amino acid hydrolase [Rhizobium sp. CECT 9324]
MNRRNFPASAERIAADIDALAGLTEPGRPYTRRAFTPLHLEGRSFLAEQFRKAGLAVHVDAGGNLVGRRAGNNPSLGTLMLGSHSDTVPDGGRFDGIAGVIAALEVARTLTEQGIDLEHDLEIVDFLAEEVSIFGVSCIGSRSMAGTRPSEWLSREVDGQTLAQGIANAGGDPGSHEIRSDIRAFLELHIEQGPILEAERLSIGVVTAIAGITRIEVKIEGRADHAGTTPMDRRADALVAASRMVLDIEALATTMASGRAHFAATVGEFSLLPNAANVIPSHVRMLIDIRAEKPEDAKLFARALQKTAHEIGSASGTTISLNPISEAAAVPMNSYLQEVLSDIAGVIGEGHRRLASGAGHDAAFIARVAPAGMIFIPCRDGRSHAAEELAETNDIALGAMVLLEAVKRLDNEMSTTTDKERH